MIVSRRSPSPIQGQLLRRSNRREVAIFLRDGGLWIADFIDGQGELVDATTWFRFNCAATSTVQGRRRMVLEAAIPLSDEMVGKIERLQVGVATTKRSTLQSFLAAIATRRPRSRLVDVLRGQFERRSVSQRDPSIM